MARRRKKHLSHKRYTDRRTEEQIFPGNNPLSPLYSLVGKKVKINRGGPNSKEGILLKAKKDYIALLAEQEVFYFMTNHIHSATQNIKENSSLAHTNTDTETFCSDSETFADLLNELKNQSIQINHGPESRVGKLLYVNPSMLVILHEEDGPIYYNLEHVKFIKTNSISEEEEALQSYRVDRSKDLNIDHSRLNSYSDLINQFKYQWVSVNRTGPEALEGVLMDEGCGFYTIVNNEETFRINPFHIKSISVGAKGSFKETNEKEEEGQEVDESTSSESCSCEESLVCEESSEEITWRPKHRIKTYDVYN